MYLVFDDQLEEDHSRHLHNAEHVNGGDEARTRSSAADTLSLYWAMASAGFMRPQASESSGGGVHWWRLVALADRRRVLRFKKEPDTSSRRFPKLPVYLHVPGQTVIHDFHPVFFVHQDVSRMDIGVNYSPLVQPGVGT